MIEFKAGALHIEGRSAKEIAERYGTPCYVYSRNEIKTNYEKFDHAFGDRKKLICYAVKANSTLAIIKLLADLGSGFDIVSGGELKRVIAAGGDPNKIVFSGVGKTELEILEAIQTGIKCFNIESESELKRIAETARKLEKLARVSFRVNPDVDAKTHPYISTGLKENKFGVDIEDALKLYKLASENPFVTPTGIDCHIGSQLTEISPIRDAAQKVVELTDQLAKSGIEIEHVDFGGGLGIKYDKESICSHEQLIVTLIDVMGDRPQEVLIEPGRSIVGTAGVLLTSIEYIKPGRHKNFAVVDAAMNDLARPSLYDAFHRIENIQESDESSRNENLYDVVGPICETGDFLGKDRILSILEGDILAVHSVGAYGMTMSSNYNTRGRAAEVLIDKDQMHLIRKRETFKDLISLENLINT